MTLRLPLLCVLIVSVSACAPESAERPSPYVVGGENAEGAAPESTARAEEGVDEEAPRAGCVPACQEGQCDDDGCGGSCGPCSVLTPFCYAGWCQLEVPPKEPSLALEPALVDFGSVAIGEVSERTLILRSVGKEVLEITRFGIAGDGAFTVMQGEQAWRSTSGGEILVELLEPWVFDAGETREVRLRYAPINESPGAATLRLVSNDPSWPEGHEVPLRGGPPIGCGAWSVSSLDFGATIFGSKSVKALTLQNCGTLPLVIEELSISGDNAGAFSWEGEAPEGLSPGESWDTNIHYEPTAGSVGALGTLQALLSWEGGSEEVGVALTGFVVVEDCPVAVVEITEESPVVPGTVLHLNGLESYSPVSEIATYSWSSDEPEGSVGRFAPSTQSAATTFGAMVTGKYRFDLSVTDSEGKVACHKASQTIRVAPESALYVELTWETPTDPDPSDQGLAVGTDLDLHLAHADAAGSDLDGDGSPEPWFDPHFDCYWFNPSPDWGPFQPPTDDDPHLTIEDIDGAGPEAIAFDLPETDVTYRIAVHAWQDHGFGVSIATVRIYLLGDKIFESQPIPLMNQDLWEVAELTWQGWPQASVLPLAAEGGGPRIFPNAAP